MTDLLTVYEDDEESNTPIDCTICNRQIQGETLFKVHLTTPQHLKKEEILAANGLIPMPPPLPEFTDFKQYLEYLQLDEPIVGLDALVQVQDAIADGKPCLKYKCKMCSVEMIMCTMVSHVVSRKHRQKYLQLKRPDLLNQNNGMAQKQPGLVARAKAAIAERQDGWGTPVPLKQSKRTQNKLHSGQMLKRDNQASYFVQERRPLMAEDFSDVFGRSSHYHVDDRANWQSNPKNDRSENAYYQDGRQRPFQDEDYNERPYLKGDDGGRPYADRAVPGRSYRDEHQDEYFSEINPRRGWNSGGDVQDDLFHGNVPRNRFADTDLRGSGYVEKGRDYAQDIEGRAGSFEMQGYARGGLGDYAQEHVPAKRKRKSRFSDATPMEVALAQKRVIDSLIPTKNPRRGPVHVHEERLDSNVMRPSVNTDNVLDVLNEVKIDNAEEANFLKQKLCDVLKEFHANKAQHVEVPSSVRDWMDQRRDLQETRNLDDHGFQQSARYDPDLRDVQERRTFPNDSAGLQEAWGAEELSRSFQDTRHVKDMRGYDKAPYQESTRYETRSTDFQQERGFQDKSRDFQRAGHFEDNLSAFREASRFEESTRVGHAEGDHRNFQNVRHIRGAEKGRGYEEYSGRALEGRYGEGEFRRFHSNLDTLRESEWDPKREMSAGRSDVRDYHPQESHWATRSLRESEGFGENQAHRPHYQRDYNPGLELYDPFQPSSPPPPQPAPPSSLDKLASTLLELVSRTSS